MEIRTRKLAPQYHKQDWRSKGSCNHAKTKHSREHILKNYQNLMQPHFNYKDELTDVLLNAPNPPLLTAVFPFSHDLGDEVNSRKHTVREKRAETMPEWYDDEEPKEPIANPQSKSEKVEVLQAKVDENPTEVKLVLMSSNVKNFKNSENLDEKVFEETFTKVDLEVEAKLKNIEPEDDYAEPEWDEPTKEEFAFEPIKPVKPNAPVYDVNLLRYHLAIGNPFAQTLVEFGVAYGSSAITFNFETKPFEKIWHYKDLEDHVHGPFSTLEMFAWTIRGCFPVDLNIAIGNSMNFIPMNAFNSFAMDLEPPFQSKILKKEPKTLQEIEIEQHAHAGKYNSPKGKKKQNAASNESATLDLKNILGINKNS